MAIESEIVSRPVGRPGVCRFCARTPSRGQHRVPGPNGPICADCVEAGLALAIGGRQRRPGRARGLERLDRYEDQSCEFCERSERWSFFGIHRSLSRVAFRASGAVICADCLDTNGDLLNRAIHG